MRLEIPPSCFDEIEGFPRTACLGAFACMLDLEGLRCEHEARTAQRLRDVEPASTQGIHNAFPTEMDLESCIPAVVGNGGWRDHCSQSNNRRAPACDTARIIGRPDMDSHRRLSIFTTRRVLHGAYTSPRLQPKLNEGHSAMFQTRQPIDHLAIAG
jgi:hypothetical protein